MNSEIVLFIYLLLSGILSTYIVIRLSLKYWMQIFGSDSYNNIQKNHAGFRPRIGGLTVFCVFSIGLYQLDGLTEASKVYWLGSFFVFLAGLIEDITQKVSPVQRLIYIFIAILIVYIGAGVRIDSLGFSWIDYFLSNYEFISLIFTLLIVGAAVNSINIIDGFNGLIGGYSILASMAMAYVAYTLGDGMILQLSLILATSVFGFFVFNFPFGKIFMGDGGAYFVGFMLAVIGLILVDRHEELSNWFTLLIFIYPMYELLYSIYRRKIIHKAGVSQPDVNHLHSLVYRKLISCDRFKHDKVICNSMVSPFMWLLSLVGIIPAVIWFDNQTVLIISAFMFMFIYTIIYKYISSDRFKFNH
jgi:UDP-GlcNAc:undecaprenyl-phosphate/decaprenyl-phosphate GlcNAc-1-phosphate transferase